MPESLELDRFTDEQLVYLSEWLLDFRAECLNRLQEFLSRKGSRCRICILDKMINRPHLKWRDAAEFYGVSQHKLYNMKREIMGELMVLQRGLGLYERRARGLSHRRYEVAVRRRYVKKPKPEAKQMSFNFYE